MNNAIAQIAAMLKQHMGLDIASVGSALIERGVRERMMQTGQSDIYAYLQMLQSGLGELQELIELVVVPETWFFRDREAILAAARLAREKIVRTPQGRVRILSLPCSTGEEPYSISMALLDAGVPASQFQIDAIDICRRSLGLAQRAVYGRNSFRGKQLEYRERYFRPLADMPTLEELAPEVRTQVTFRFGNMLEPDFMQGEIPYDFIFCRNVLIYFDRDVQVQAVNMLERLLGAQGCIFVGPAEAGLLLRPQLESLGIPLSFGFRRKSAQPSRPDDLPVRGKTSAAGAASAASLAPALPAWSVPSPSLPPLPRPAAVKAVAATPPVISVPAPQLQSAPPAVADDVLAQARRCADRGELEQAAALCQQHLRNRGPDATAYYLQGLICDARQDPSAAQQLYRKAIYLQPDHREALLQLAALLEAQGDHAAAGRLQQRAERTLTPGHSATSGNKEQSHA